MKTEELKKEIQEIVHDSVEEICVNGNYGFLLHEGDATDKVLAACKKAGLAFVVKDEDSLPFLPNEVDVKLGIDDLMPSELDIAFRRGYNQKHNDATLKGYRKTKKIEGL